MSKPSASRGFTMIELLVAMAVFSFLLLIIVVGFTNIVRIHSQAVASNLVQDNARNAMDQMVQAVRNSVKVETPDTSTAGSVSINDLCLMGSSGKENYWVDASGVLWQSDGCGPRTNNRRLTSTAVKVFNLTVTVKTGGPGILKPGVEIKLTAGSNNGTATLVGGVPVCGPTNADRAFCSVVTLTSGAVAR